MREYGTARKRSGRQCRLPPAVRFGRRITGGLPRAPIRICLPAPIWTESHAAKHDISVRRRGVHRARCRWILVLSGAESQRGRGQYRWTQHHHRDPVGSSDVSHTEPGWAQITSATRSAVHSAPPTADIDVPLAWCGRDSLLNSDAEVAGASCGISALPRSSSSAERVCRGTPHCRIAMQHVSGE
jgi:hypothetical protein